MSNIKMSEEFYLPLTNKHGVVEDDSGLFVADLSSKEMDFAMCYAINNHDKLTSRVAELEAALLAIKSHQQALTPNGFEFSGVWQIANKALKESGGG